MTVTGILAEHPCFSSKAHKKYGRLHLPVARKCNISCNYCEMRIGGLTYHSYRPATASKILSPLEALEQVSGYANKDWLKVVGIAGPGEPLANHETLEVLDMIHKSYPFLYLCLSTNGLLLPRNAERLANSGVATLTVTVNTVSPGLGAQIYSYITYDSKVVSGTDGAEILIKNQLEGIEKAVELGIIVKVNTVLIPSINMDHAKHVAKEVRSRGATIQNIIPLIPLGKFKQHQAPDCDQLSQTRHICEKLIVQFRQCKQCSADAVGIPGQETKSCISGSIL